VGIFRQPFDRTGREGKGKGRREKDERTKTERREKGGVQSEKEEGKAPALSLLLLATHSLLFTTHFSLDYFKC